MRYTCALTARVGWWSLLLAVLLMAGLGWLNLPVVTAADQASEPEFVVTKHEGRPPFTVQFVNVTQTPFTSSQWDFGDGQSSTESNPFHTYAITGTYSVKLTVNSPLGTASITKADLIKVHAFPAIHPDGWDLNFGDYGRLDPGCGSINAVNEVSAAGPIIIATRCNFIARYLADGTRDVNFDRDGVLRVPAAAFALQADLKMIAADGLKLARYQSDGTPDPTFGDNGIADHFPSVAPGLGQFLQARVQPDGKIVAVGGKEGQAIIARYLDNGALDLTFNTVGYVLYRHPDELGSVSQWDHLVLQADGKFLVGRYADLVVDPFYNQQEGTVLLARYNLDGALDATFADAGVWTSRYINAPPAYRLLELFQQTDGKIAINIEENHAGPPSNVAYLLHNNGQLSQNLYAVLGAPQFIYVDPSDRIWGGVDNKIVRLLPDGTLDSDFPALDSKFSSSGLLVQADGNLLIYAGSQFVRYLDNSPKPPPPPPPPPVAKPLVLIYAVLDNNLGDDWMRLINNIELGAHPGSDVRLMVDGPGSNDAYVYKIKQDAHPFCPSRTNPTCSGRYVDGQSRWTFVTEDTALPTSLYQFVVDGLNAFPKATQVALVLIGHGSGWGANVLPAQPSFWKKQNDTLGGMLWDDHTGSSSGTRSLSTLALADALRSAQLESKRPIDLLYLDGCSMGMTEIAYELAGTANYLLASPNTDWATFSYDQLLPEVKSGVAARTLGERWLAREAALLRSQPGHPFTLALTDLQQMRQFSTTISALGAALQSALPTQREQIAQAFTTSDRYDSNYDAKLDLTDNYLDLKDFARHLQQVGLTSSAVISAAQQVETVLASAVISTVYASGTPWVAEDQTWAWQTMGGLSIYAPLGQDEAKRRIYYNSNNLTWAADTTWDEFLAAFWAGSAEAPAAAAGEMPVCQATTDGCSGLANPQPTGLQPVQTLYLTFVKR